MKIIQKLSIGLLALTFVLGASTPAIGATTTVGLKASAKVSTSTIATSTKVVKAVKSVVVVKQAPINLRSAGNFTVLSQAGISTTGITKVVGNIGVSPIAATGMTGFTLKMDRSGNFSRSSRVSGKIYAADYKAPTSNQLTIAIGDMQTAYNDAAGRLNPMVTELGTGNIGGLTLTPGLYKWTTPVTIPKDVILSGGKNDVWVFQIAGTLDIAPNVKVILKGGAQEKNIFWQVAGNVSLDTKSVFSGNILGKTAIVLKTGATLNGKALAQTAVTLDANKIK